MTYIINYAFVNNKYKLNSLFLKENIVNYKLQTKPSNINVTSCELFFM